MTTEKYTRFEPADFLADNDDVAAYLQMALEESAEDPTAVPRPG
jgi:DNA-binding phage protein